MKVILIGGYPGSGKSTIVRELVKQLNESNEDLSYLKKEFTMDYISMRRNKLFIMGSYSTDEKFPGTDRFSMAVQPMFEQFVLQYSHQSGIILLEGDRLFNSKTIQLLSANKIPYLVFIVKTDEEVLKKRRDARSSQNETWLKGRYTKVNNISKQIAHTILPNHSEGDLYVSVQLLLQEINNGT